MVCPIILRARAAGRNSPAEEHHLANLAPIASGAGALPGLCSRIAPGGGVLGYAKRLFARRMQFNRAMEPGTLFASRCREFQAPARP